MPLLVCSKCLYLWRDVCIHVLDICVAMCTPNYCGVSFTLYGFTTAGVSGRGGGGIRRMATEDSHLTLQFWCVWGRTEVFGAGCRRTQNICHFHVVLFWAYAVGQMCNQFMATQKQNKAMAIVWEMVFRSWLFSDNHLLLVYCQFYFSRKVCDLRWKVSELWTNSPAYDVTDRYFENWPWDERWRIVPSRKIHERNDNEC